MSTCLKGFPVQIKSYAILITHLLKENTKTMRVLPVYKINFFLSHFYCIKIAISLDLIRYINKIKTVLGSFTCHLSFKSIGNVLSYFFFISAYLK